MFGFFTQCFLGNNKRNRQAKAVYDQVAADALQPVFYAKMGVPDTLDGRFDMLILHCFMVGRQAEYQKDAKFQQALFDQMFKAMDPTLRELGIGDLGVPKHMKRMMKAFNGRVHAYAEALNSGNDEQLFAALKRNVYGTVESPDDKQIKALQSYVMDYMKEDKNEEEQSAVA